MPDIIDMGYDFAGTLLDAATYPAAEALASPGDTIRINYSNAYQNPRWFGFTIAPSKNVRITGALPRQGIALSYDASNYPFMPTSDCQIDNFCICNCGGGFYVNSAISIDIDRCIFDSAGLAVLVYAATLIRMRSCLVRNSYSAIYNIGGTCQAFNVTARGCVNAFVDSGSNTLTTKNCVADGCQFDYYNSPTMINFAGMHGSVGSNYIDLKANDPHFWGRDFAFCNGDDMRITKASSIYGNGVAVSGLTEDLYGRTYNATPSRGCFEGWDSPTELATNEVKSGTTYIILDGSSRTGTLNSNPKASAATALTLASGGDGLTWTLSFTSTETDPTGILHDASHNIVASGQNGEKIRGLTNNTAYHVHVICDGKTLSDPFGPATSATLTANYSAGAANILTGHADRVDGTVTNGSAEAMTPEELAAWEAARNTDPGAAFVLAHSQGGPESYLIRGAAKVPAYVPESQTLRDFPVATEVATSVPELALRSIALANGTVAGLLADRIYPSQASPSAVYPLALTSLISSDYAEDMSGLADITEPNAATVQFDIFAETYAKAKEVAKALRIALNGFSCIVTINGTSHTIRRIRITNENDDIDNPKDGKADGIFRVIQEFEIWYL